MFQAMVAPLLKSALKLSKPERILLVEQIWDSIANEKDVPDLSDTQKTELDQRLARLKRTGPLGSDWGVVKQRLKKRA